MTVRESPSEEQKKYVARVCPEYHPFTSGNLGNLNYDNYISCDSCIHWNNGNCAIYDEILTGIDQT